MKAANEKARARNAQRQQARAEATRLSGLPASDTRQHQARELVASGLSDTQVAALRRRGFTIQESEQLSSGKRVVRLGVPRGLALEKARQQVDALGTGISADLNHYYRPALHAEHDAAKPCSGALCGAADMVGWDKAGYSCGPSPRVGIIDTALDLDAKDLAGRRIEVLQPAGQKRGSSPGHGTTIASLLGTLLPDARFIAIDGFTAGEDGQDRTDALSLAKAIDRLTSHGVDVINLSLSGPPNRLVQEAVTSAVERGVIIVAAAGNDGAKAPPSYPAAYADVLAVTAVDAEKNLYRRASTGDYIDLAAPGVGIFGESKAEGPSQGTSLATPFVAAAAAVLKASNPGTTPRNAGARLKAGAFDLGPVGYDEFYGWGLVQTAGLCADPGLIASQGAPSSSASAGKLPALEGPTTLEQAGVASATAAEVSPAAGQK
ncbi:S8 family serine peptidase [Terrihabitans rhizophilus]|uniref:S8 family serine peptidase n=1 Tax=Terrihabitans rhizophilus TaxID=3092662 RepID=UPI0029DE761B|nr:S8 family serine peptidase [Terrihabitans sp. PJ23]